MRIHEQQMQDNGRSRSENAVIELHESEVQIATSHNAAIFLQHAEVKAKAMIKISVRTTYKL